MAVLYSLVAWKALADGLPGDAPPQAGPLVRIGEVQGKTYDRGRSSFDARGTAFVTTQDDAARVWDDKTLEPLTEPLAHPKLKAFFISGDGRTVLTRDDREARLRNVATSAVHGVIRVERSTLKFAEVSPDGSHVLTVDDQDPLHVRVWRAGEPQPAMQLVHGGADQVVWAEFDPTGSRIVSFSHPDRTFRIRNVNDGDRGLGWSVQAETNYFYLLLLLVRYAWRAVRDTKRQ